MFEHLETPKSLENDQQIKIKIETEKNEKLKILEISSILS